MLLMALATGIIPLLILKIGLDKHGISLNKIIKGIFKLVYKFILAIIDIIKTL